MTEVPAHATVPAELVLMVEEMKDAHLTSSQIATWTQHDPVMAKALSYIQGLPSPVGEELKPYWLKKLELSTEAGCIVWSS